MALQRPPSTFSPGDTSPTSHVFLIAMLSSTLSMSLLPSQVGGHPGILTTEDGSLIIKSALPNEISFYQTVAVDPGFQPLRDFVPQFYGTLRLEGQIDPDADGNDLGSVKPVEENLTFTFLKPNVLDVKLGTVLYDDDATAEKKERMDKVARETTSAETGIRLTGFQVYDLARNQPIFTPKIYGKSIKPADLPDGIARFFPLPSNSQAPSPPPEPSPSSRSNEIETFKHEHGTGLPADILIPMLTEICSEVEEIRDALSKVDVRMVGASLLIIYEADWERAREGMRLLHEYQSMEADSEKGVEEDEEDDGDDSDSESPGPPFIVRLIDFAHTKILPGQGRDEGVLLGLDTVIKLLGGRIEQIKASTPSSANAPHAQNPQHTLKSNTYTPVASHDISDLTELVSMSTSLDTPKDIART
ncbi:SAICAR synthase-like protein [Laetiporus sulphureus 93-53]|uniref:Kinase n=1 Tax=Laetiporus sulphureus 93-53 TaxID=1314785 RepID=A0A165H2N2_9APHY|nr:SAICAR synthase-like protein [Laetiporus sulphureus 93-53]KZT11162.1 SAICAR synthase-like protein [Laetiporus sulphureus 93-53]